MTPNNLLSHLTRDSRRIPSFRHSNRFSLVLAIALVICLSSCIRIAPSTVQLAQEVEIRTLEMKQLHMEAVDQLFDLKYQQVERFVDERWVPVFYQNFLVTSNLYEDLNQSKYFTRDLQNRMESTLKPYLTDDGEAKEAIDQVLNGIVSGRQAEEQVVNDVLQRYVNESEVRRAVTDINTLLGATETGWHLEMWAEAARKEISKQRRAMLRPITDTRKKVEGELIAAYDELISANQMIATRLEIASKTTAKRDEIYNAVGAQRLRELRSKLSDFSSEVDRITESGEDLLEKGDDAKAQLKAISEELKTELNKLKEQF